MDREKHILASTERDLGHEQVASGNAVIVEDTGNDADRQDMYRMGKVQQMQASYRRFNKINNTN
jgi:hypothetical protein